VRKAEARSSFCKKHGEAIFGALLGALTYGEPVDEIEHLCGEERPCAMARARRGIEPGRKGRDPFEAQGEPSARSALLRMTGIRERRS
jgi:hypothetical protein